MDLGLPVADLEVLHLDLALLHDDFFDLLGGGLGLLLLAMRRGLRASLGLLRLLSRVDLLVGLHRVLDDVISVTQKIVSKAEGAIVDLSTIEPRAEAIDYAERWKRDPRQVEVVLREAVRVVRMDRGVIITETSHGFVLANSGVDASNVGPRSGEIVTLLPRDPDASASRIRAAIAARTGVAPGVIITDSFGRPWRLGITDVAIGLAGIAALDDLRGRPDADGRVMAATVRAVADQIAAAAELALGKSARRPLAFIRGARPAPSETGSVRESLMPADWDLFR